MAVTARSIQSAVTSRPVRDRERQERERQDQVVPEQKAGGWLSRFRTGPG